MHAILHQQRIWTKLVIIIRDSWSKYIQPNLVVVVLHCVTKIS